jgi:serine/threonine-protein kinase
MTASHLPSSSDTLLGKYQLGRELGRGGMGVVFEAMHLRLGQKVAIKLVLPEVGKQPELAHRFEREARAAACLRSRHTARVLDVDTTPDGVPFLVMELLDGWSLRDELARVGPLPIADAVRYVLEACDAMDEAHRAGIIHRDLKPSNLFLCRDEGRPFVKVLDFGISKAASENSADFRTATNVPLGTCHYMSPEQARSASSVDARSDVWSLGVVLYELLTNEVPFGGDNPLNVLVAVATQSVPPLRKVRPDVPEALASAIERALCKDVESRFPTVRALADALAPFAPGAASYRPSQPRLAAVTPAPPSARVDLETTQLPPQTPRDTTAGALGSASGVDHVAAKAPPPSRLTRPLSGAAAFAAVGLLGLGAWLFRAATPNAGVTGAHPLSSTVVALPPAPSGADGRGDAHAQALSAATSARAPQPTVAPDEAHANEADRARQADAANSAGARIRRGATRPATPPPTKPPTGGGPAAPPPSQTNAAPPPVRPPSEPQDPEILK